MVKRRGTRWVTIGVGISFVTLMALSFGMGRGTIGLIGGAAAMVCVLTGGFLYVRDGLRR